MLTCIFMVAILKDLYCILMASCPRRCRLQAILKQRGLAFKKGWRRTFPLFTGTGVLSTYHQNIWELWCRLLEDMKLNHSLQCS